MVLIIIGLTLMEKVELATYQLKGVSQIWFKQWKEVMTENLSPLDWEKFKVSLIDRFFSLEMCKAKLLELISIYKGNMSAEENALRFTQLSRYSPTMIRNPRPRMSNLISGISERVIKECFTITFVNDMGISSLLVC